MFSKDIYNDLQKLVSNLSKDQVLEIFKCHNINNDVADLNIGNMCVTFLFRYGKVYLSENVEFYDKNGHFICYEHKPFDFNEFTLLELKYIEHLENRIKTYHEDELLKYFRNMTRKELKMFIFCSTCGKNFNEDTFDDIIDDWCNIKKY